MVIPETVEILHKLMKADYHLYALSNWFEEKFSLIKIDLLYSTYSKVS
jgi:hypothetical protein